MENERLITIREAAQLCRVHRRTIYQWFDEGCLGVRLDSVRLGPKRLTSQEAVARFKEEVEAIRGDGDARCALSPYYRQRNEAMFAGV